MDLKIRKEIPADHAAVHSVNREAFGRPEEAERVERMRKSGAFIPNLSLVAEVDGLVIGHLMFASGSIRDDQGKESESLILFPPAIQPGWQKMGYGAHLMNIGLAVARELGYRSVIAPGNGSYCLRFGFAGAENFRIENPDTPSDSGLLTLELEPDSLRVVSGSVTLPPGYHATG